MESGYIAIVAAVYTGLLIVSQRIVARHQGHFRNFLIFTVILLFLRMNRFQENIIGLLIAVVIGYLFWLLIGRYNKVGNADEAGIKVFGLDD
jgi:xanthine/uracil permease